MEVRVKGTTQGMWWSQRNKKNTVGWGGMEKWVSSGGCVPEWTFLPGVVSLQRPLAWASLPISGGCSPHFGVPTQGPSTHVPYLPALHLHGRATP